MSKTVFKSFEEMKKSHTNHNFLSDNMRDKCIQDLDKIYKVLSKSKRKPTLEEKI